MVGTNTCATLPSRIGRRLPWLWWTRWKASSRASGQGQGQLGPRSSGSRPGRRGRGAEDGQRQPLQQPPPPEHHHRPDHRPHRPSQPSQHRGRDLASHLMRASAQASTRSALTGSRTPARFAESGTWPAVPPAVGTRSTQPGARRGWLPRGQETGRRRTRWRRTVGSVISRGCRPAGFSAAGWASFQRLCAGSGSGAPIAAACQRAAKEPHCSNSLLKPAGG